MAALVLGSHSTLLWKGHTAVGSSQGGGGGDQAMSPPADEKHCRLPEELLISLQSRPRPIEQIPKKKITQEYRDPI